MKLLHICALRAALAAALVASGRADETATLNPSADTSLFETNPDDNFGGGSPISAGTTRNGLRSRIPLRFDLTGLPANATITSVTLKLTVEKTPSGPVNSTFGLCRMLQDWGEGAGGGGGGGGGSPAQSGEASWNNRFAPDVPWTTPGGSGGDDYVSSSSATTFIAGVGDYTFGSTSGLVADAQAWLADPSSNFGWLLLTLSEGTASTARLFGSREDPVSPPVLTLNYTLPSPPATAPTLSPVSLVANQVRFSFAAEASRGYVVEYRTDLSTGAWQTLTNVPSQVIAGPIAIFDSLTSSNRFYRVHTP